MNINKRTQDITEVFNRNYQVNNDYQGRSNFLEQRQAHFNKLYNMKDKTTKRQELRQANSINGQVKNLNDRMSAFTAGQNRSRLNDLKNNFK